jgi:hypothetical protein
LRIEWRLRGGFKGGREVIRIGAEGKEEGSRGGGVVIWLRRRNVVKFKFLNNNNKVPITV